MTINILENSENLKDCYQVEETKENFSGFYHCIFNPLKAHYYHYLIAFFYKIYFLGIYANLLCYTTHFITAFITALFGIKIRNNKDKRQYYEVIKGA